MSSDKPDYMGQSYNYSKQIKLPSQIEMSSDGNLNAFGKDIAGLIGYTQALISGGVPKNAPLATTVPYLGNKFFVQTPGQCTAPDETIVDRFMYINNVPQGNIPFISSAMNVNFSEFRGLIPGTMGNLNAFSPSNIMSAFTSGENPPCQQITLQTVNEDNETSMETQYITIDDIQNMDPCNFTDGHNPITNLYCTQAMTNIDSSPIYDNETEIIQNLISFSLGVLAIYAIFKFSRK